MPNKFNTCIKTVMAMIFLSAVGFSSLVLAQSASLAGRHIYILHSGLDAVWGSYMMVVENEGGSGPVPMRFPLMLPVETEDWSPQQGLAQDQIELNSDGGLIANATFERPQTLVVMGFRVAGSGGKAVMTLKVPMEIGEFTIMATKGEIEIESEDLKSAGEMDFSGHTYDQWTVQGVEEGREITLTVKGVPEGRRSYYILGAIFSFVLIVLVAFLALRTRPKLKDAQTEFESAHV